MIGPGPAFCKDLRRDTPAVAVGTRSPRYPPDRLAFLRLAQYALIRLEMASLSAVLQVVFRGGVVLGQPGEPLAAAAFRRFRLALGRPGRTLAWVLVPRRMLAARCSAAMSLWSWIIWVCLAAMALAISLTARLLCPLGTFTIQELPDDVSGYVRCVYMPFASGAGLDSRVSSSVTPNLRAPQVGRPPAQRQRYRRAAVPQRQRRSHARGDDFQARNDPRRRRSNGQRGLRLSGEAACARPRPPRREARPRAVGSTARKPEIPRARGGHAENDRSQCGLRAGGHRGDTGRTV